jgi:hypothetical protein
MKLVRFDSYDEYKHVQVSANKLKYRNVYAEGTELRTIAEHFRRHATQPKSGLCHGVRNGYEVRALRALLPSVDIVGTDIADTAAGIDNCIVWDMHELKPEWIGSIDFMYSNSWDHTYDPERLFNNWSQCLSSKGSLYLTYTDAHSDAGATEDTKVDAFGCSLDELLRLVARAFVVDDVLETRPHVTGKALRNRLSYLRAGRFKRLFTAPLRSRRILTLVLKKRPAADADVATA